MQRIAFQKLLSDKRAEGLYLLYGSEMFLLDTVKRYLKESFLAPETAALNLTVLGAENLTAVQLIETCETLPVFSDRRVVMVEDFDFTKEGVARFKDVYEGLYDYIQKLPSGLVLILISPHEALFRGRFVKKAEEVGETVSFQKLNESELLAFIRRRSERDGRSLTQAAQHLLLARSEYLNREENKNLYDVDHVMVSLFDAKEGVIEETDVAELLPAPFTETIFQLMDCLSAKDRGEALRVYHSIRRHGQDVFAVFYMLVRQIRNLIRVKAYEQKPYGGNGPKELGISPFEYKKLQGAVRKFDFPALFQMMRAVYDTESALKESPADPDILLTVLLHRLCE